MQYLLSGYANWYAKRHQRTVQLFRGRFKSELVGDESYFWPLSRYVHLNPVRGKKPLFEYPSEWRWSNYQSKRSMVAGRDLAASLAHRHTTATQRELVTAFGLTYPDGVSSLIRRA